MLVVTLLLTKSVPLSLRFGSRLCRRWQAKAIAPSAASPLMIV